MNGAEGYENSSIKAVIDRVHADEAAVIKYARKFWVDAGYGVPRSAMRDTRIDKGVLRKKNNHGNEKGWLRSRRAAADAIREPMRGDDLGDESLMLSWTATHAKEKAFQQSRSLKRKVESLNAGELLPHEISGNLRAAAVRQKIKDGNSFAVWTARLFRL